MTDPFRYEIRNPNIAKDLLAQGFTVYTTNLDTWTLQAPPDLSSTKARELISVCIKLYKASRELGKAKIKYENLVNHINELNMSR